MTVSNDTETLAEALQAGPQIRDALCKFGKMVYDDNQIGGELQQAVTKLSGFNYLWSARNLSGVIKQSGEETISYNLINDHRRGICRCPAGWEKSLNGG